MAFFHEDSDDIEAAAGGYTDADEDQPDELPGALNDKPSHLGNED